jgi:putative zinc finger protein
MPSKPGMEPTVEELSAYVDSELVPSDQARVAAHVAGCAACQERIAGLRQTAYAIRGLPMETPPRTFGLPQVRSRGWRWAPVGWVGTAAVAVLLVGIGLTHLPSGGTTASNAGTTAIHANNGGAGYQPAEPARSAGVAAALDQSKAALAGRAVAPANSAIVMDPADRSRSMMLGTDATSYPTSGVMQVRLSTTGLSADETASFRLWLVRDAGSGYAIRLAPPKNAPTNPFQFDAAYSISQMPLQAPVAGTYRLEAVVQLSDGSALIADVPLTITP